MKSTFAAICAAGAVMSSVGFSAAQAQNQLGQPQGQSGVRNPTNVVADFSVQTVGPVLNEIGAQWQVQTSPEGEQYIAVLYGGTLYFNIYFAACLGEGRTRCVGMASTALFEVNANQQTVHAFNARNAFASAGIATEKVAYINRYDISDYGIPRGNIASSITNFAALAARFSQELETSSQTVSLDGYASDMSASHLNRQGIEGVTGLEIRPADRVQAHQVGFEDGAEMVQQLLKDKSVPRNKISNTRD